MNMKELINHPSATIVDVREVFEFSSGHVPGSINIPLGQVPGRMEELGELDKPLILCCASGNRSGQATYFLHAKGFKDVFNGGSWRDVDYHKEKAA